MKWGKHTVILIGTLLITTSIYLKASPGEGNEEEFIPQISQGIELPVWGPGEMVGNIDVRIWPEEMVLWLERENLRQIIRDPNTPLEERENLKQVLARQLAWGRRWVNE